MAARHRAPARVRRTWPQRLVLGVGGLLSLTLLAGALGLGWGWWQLNQITRTDVQLTGSVADGEPENWLVVGSDSRQGGKDAETVTGQRSDTIMVLRVDPKRRQAKVLSLPRDLWVDIAGSGGQQRINAAFNKGRQTLIDTVEENFGVPVHHYLEVDFDGFKSMVDSIGGVPVYFSSAARDTMSGLEVLHPGCVTLNGEAALAFARSRHLTYMQDGSWETDATGDLGRINRQQLLIRRTIDKAMDSGLDLLRIKRLVESGTKNITVDRGVTVSDLIALGERFRSFDSNSLESITIPAEQARTSGGAAVLEVDEEAAAPVLAQFRSKDDPMPATTVPSTSSVPVLVLNSSGTQGMAANVAGALRTVGFDIVRWGNGSELGHSNLVGTEVHYAPGSQDRALLVARHLTEVPALVEDPVLDDGQVAVLVGSEFTTVEPGAKPQEGAALLPPSSGGAATAPSGEAPVATTPTTDTVASTPSSTTTTTIVGHLPGEAPPGVDCG